MLSLFHVITVIAATASASPVHREVLSTQAWQGTSTFPESPYLLSRPNTGIAFSGGGSRAFAATLGQLAGLHQLGLLQSVRYIGGLSGSSWALVPLLFATNAPDTGELLGLPIVAPSALSKEVLASMSPRCARSFAQPSIVAAFEESLKARGAFSDPLSAVADSWTDTVQRLFLDPVGIPRGARFSWTAATVADIKARNHTLQNATFLLPAGDWPFPLIAATLVGPVAFGPYGPRYHNFTRFEFSPQYVGQLHVRDVSYQAKSAKVGGAIEPFAFEAASGGIGCARPAGAPGHGLPPGAAAGVIPDVPAPTKVLDLATVLSVSSFFPGGFLESLPLLDVGLGMRFPYWSPADGAAPPAVHDTLFADGGSVENVSARVRAFMRYPTWRPRAGPFWQLTADLFPIPYFPRQVPLISLLQRRVQRIIVFFNSAHPLLPASRWNVTADPPRGQLSEDLSSFFGVFPEGAAAEAAQSLSRRSWDYRRNQVFATGDFKPLALALQRAQQPCPPPCPSPSTAALGTGAIARARLTTVENRHWGIPAGVDVDVTFVLLGRVEAWEARLPPDVRAAAIPPGDDLSQTMSSGPFAFFPFYPTGVSSLSAEETNLLANMVGWSVLANADVFMDVLGPTSA